MNTFLQREMNIVALRKRQLDAFAKDYPDDGPQMSHVEMDQGSKVIFGPEARLKLGKIFGRDGWRRYGHFEASRAEWRKLHHSGVYVVIADMPNGRQIVSPEEFDFAVPKEVI